MENTEEYEKARKKVLSGKLIHKATPADVQAFRDVMYETMKAKSYKGKPIWSEEELQRECYEPSDSYIRNIMKTSTAEVMAELLSW